MENPKRPRLSGPATGLEDLSRQDERLDSDDSCTPEDRSNQGSRTGTPLLKTGKKTRGRVKINMEFIDNKLRRYTTFSKRKSGIMKKAHELATLTGTQVMLLVASETGHVYTFATRKLQPILSSEAGKQLIQTCLNSPDPNESAASPNQQDNQRMSAQGFEEPELSYAPADDTKDGLLQKTYHILNAISAQQHEQSPSPSSRHMEPQVSTPPVNLVSMNSSAESGRSSVHFQNSQSFTLMPPQSGSPQLQHQPILTEQSSGTRMHMVPVTQDRSGCSSIPPPNVHSHHHSPQGRTADDHRVTLLNSYSTLQRPVPGTSPLLVTGANPLQLSNSQVRGRKLVNLYDSVSASY